MLTQKCPLFSYCNQITFKKFTLALNLTDRTIARLCGNTVTWKYCDSRVLYTRQNFPLHCAVKEAIASQKGKEKQDWNTTDGVRSPVRGLVGARAQIDAHPEKNSRLFEALSGDVEFWRLFDTSKKCNYSRDFANSLAHAF